jgi:topoisomerase-4 subunit A
LPSARGQGEPLTSKLNPDEGIAFVEMITGAPDNHVILMTNRGYGFLSTVASLVVKNKNGKACMQIPDGAVLLSPLITQTIDNHCLAMVSATGRLLIIGLNELPVLSKGKGNRLMSFSKTTDTEQQDDIVLSTVLSNSDTLVLTCQKRTYTLKPKDWAHYQGVRGRKGALLPRGLQRVSDLTVQKENV